MVRSSIRDRERHEMFMICSSSPLLLINIVVFITHSFLSESSVFKTRVFVLFFRVLRLLLGVRYLSVMRTNTKFTITIRAVVNVMNVMHIRNVFSFTSESQ